MEFEEFANVPNSADAGGITNGDVVAGKASVQYLPGSGVGFGDVDIGGIACQPAVHDDAA